MKKIILIFALFFAQTVYAQVVFNEVQISPINERFIELYNQSNSDVDLTGWYIQRKTTTGTSFGSLVSSTLLKSKIIKANGYFLISRNQLANSDVVAGDITLTASNIIRIRNSKGDDVDQVEWGTIPDGKSTQRLSALEWITNIPTPRAINSSNADVQNQSSAVASSPQNQTLDVASFPVDPQIIADAGSSTRTVSTGAPVIFTGRVFGLKKEPIENARLVWSFGDGVRAEGVTVSHTYYYPGDYIAVLDASSGYYSANDRVSVRVVAPLITLTTGGDAARSFVVIENFGADEIDLSSWQVVSGNKNFILPQNTILGAKKKLTIASEVSGLSTPLGSSALLNFPNGTRVEMKSPTTVTTPSAPVHVATKAPAVVLQKQASAVAQTKANPAKIESRNQEASVINSLPSRPLSSPKKENGMWLWYTSIAFLGALALLGIRFIKNKEEEKTNPADEYEIIEDFDENNEDTNEPH